MENMEPETQADSIIVKDCGGEGEEDLYKVLNNATSRTNQLATEKNQLMSQLQSLTNHLAEAKRKCEDLEAEMGRVPEQEHRDTEIQQLRFLKDALSGKDKLVCNKNKYFDKELPAMEREGQSMMTVLEHTYCTNTSTLTSHHSKLEQAKEQDSLLSFKLWQIEDSNHESKHTTEQLIGAKPSFVNKIEHGEMPGQSLLSSVKEEIVSVSKNISEATEACRILSDV